MNSVAKRPRPSCLTDAFAPITRPMHAVVPTTHAFNTNVKASKGIVRVGIEEDSHLASKKEKDE